MNSNTLKCPGRSRNTSSSGECGEVRCSKTSNLHARCKLEAQTLRVGNTYRVPANFSREAVRIAAGVVTSRDVGESRRCGPVEERVEEAQHGLTSRDEPIIDERDDAGEDGTRATRPPNQAGLLLEHDLHVVTHGRHIWERTSSAVELARIRVAEFGQVCADDGLLVACGGEEVGEAAGRERGRRLWDTSGRSDRCHARLGVVSCGAAGRVNEVLTMGSRRGRSTRRCCSWWAESRQHRHHRRRTEWKYHEHQVVRKQCTGCCR